ncbi:ATP-dependent DNA helicase RecQ [Sporosarcina sp. Sa2YVA2]|uniref:ATP-dependent DNA helicase RecQ n=1 Tax=Sporosarcina quadrami TaxID=2762234 RepID=A0ABR8UDQ5_9BACL|nr:ATP-dependent DNA helicase RecQ [Sporosarcina quadrami]MBD7986168.1 ATP-dependent DNA helicase RecQ [Sporosarcina quadrami]
MNLTEELQRRFGYTEFRPGQQEVIEHVLEGRDTIAVLPTGMGKSLCYQLPGYLMNGSVLIVSPLVSLMEDQVAQMRKNGEKRVVALNSFLSYSEREKVIRQLDHFKFIFVSPEMLSRRTVVDYFRKLQLALIVVDEAHCISQWGFDFRPDYLRLGDFLKIIDRPPILALTATADQKVMFDIPYYLQMRSPVVERQSLDRKNICYSVIRLKSSIEKMAWIKNRVSTTTGPGIIYTSSRKRSDELAKELQSIGVSCQSYHAGKEQDDRSIIQSQFYNGELDWICATNAFGMGIHIGNIRQVIHEHMPSTVADYSQEVGRAGRDGLPSVATLLYMQSDEQLTSFIIQTDIPKEEQVRYYNNLLIDGMAPEEAAKLAGLSETGKRVIDYYMERFEVVEIIEKLLSLAEEKNTELQTMLSLIVTTNCIRKNILSYFGEESNLKIPQCCSNCSLPEMEWLTVEKPSMNKHAIMTWDERITKLLG